MGIHLELLKTRLFDMDVNIISIFPGSDKDATTEQIAEEMNRSLSQIAAGDYELVTDFDD